MPPSPGPRHSGASGGPSLQQSPPSCIDGSPTPSVQAVGLMGPPAIRFRRRSGVSRFFVAGAAEIVGGVPPTKRSRSGSPLPGVHPSARSGSPSQLPLSSVEDPASLPSPPPPPGVSPSPSSSFPSPVVASSPPHSPSPSLPPPPDPLLPGPSLPFPPFDPAFPPGPPPLLSPLALPDADPPPLGVPDVCDHLVRVTSSSSSVLGMMVREASLSPSSTPSRVSRIGSSPITSPPEATSSASPPSAPRRRSPRRESRPRSSEGDPPPVILQSRRDRPQPRVPRVVGVGPLGPAPSFDFAPPSWPLPPHWEVIQAFNLDDLGRLGYGLRTQKHIPYRLRDRVRLVFQRCLDLLLTCSSEDARSLCLKLLVLLPAMLFRAHDTGLGLLTCLENFRFLFWKPLLAPPQRVLLARRPSDRSSAEGFASEVSRRVGALIKEGEVGRAFQFLTSSSLRAAPSEETVQRLAEKHPVRDTDVGEDVLSHSISDQEALVLPDSVIHRALWKAPRGSSPGVDGLRFEHLQDLLRERGSPSSGRLLQSLSSLVNLAQSGSLPPWFYSFVAGANLVALDKGNGDVRPIAMGCTWRKLIARALADHCREDFASFFQPFQFGVASSCGAETVLHTVRALSSAHPDWVVFKTDFSNAFNSVFRNVALQAVKQRFPGVFPWIRAIYTPKSSLWADLGPDHHRVALLSAEGAQQGDPLGPFLFCVVMQEVLLRANETLAASGGGVALGFMDDISGVAPEEAVCAALPVLQRVAASCGLRLRLDKCCSYCPSGGALDRLPDAVPRAIDGLEVLGAPLGSPAFVDAFLSDKLKEVVDLTPLFSRLTDKQQSFLLLRLCLSQKFSYLLRVVPPESLSQVSVGFDGHLEGLLGNLLGLSRGLERSQWLQATMAVSEGGLGLCSAARTRWAAFVASFAQSLPLVRSVIQRLGLGNDLGFDNLSESPCPYVQSFCSAHAGLVEVVAVRLGPGGLQKARELIPSIQSLSSQPPKDLQRKLSHVLSLAAQSELLSSLAGDACGRAVSRVLSSAEEGGAWLTAIPKTPLTSISPAVFSLRLRARLGLDLCSSLSGTPCVCSSGEILDAAGFHLSAACPVGGERNRTHDAVVHTWSSLLKRAGYLCRMEDPACFREVRDSDRRADLVVENWFDGRRGIFDVSIIHPWSSTSNKRPVRVGYGENISQVSRPERAAVERESDKNSKYRGHLPADAVFSPLVFESYGRWGPAARKVFSQCVDRIVASSFLPKSAVVAYWRQRFGIVLQCYLGRGFLDRVNRISSRACSASQDESVRVDFFSFDHCRA